MATLRGHRTTLRPLLQSDLPLLHKWLNDPEIMQFWDGRDHPATLDRVEARFRRSIDGSDTDTYRYMIEATVSPDGDPAHAVIGMVQHGRVHPRAKNTQIEIIVGEQLYRDTGFGRDALETFLGYLFDTMKLSRVWFIVRASNDRAVQIAERFGFVREGLLREHDALEGKLVDVVVFAMLSSEWKERQRT